jgi:hypothetical protein
LLEELEAELGRRVPADESEALEFGSALLRLRLDTATSLRDLALSAVTRTLPPSLRTSIKHSKSTIKPLISLVSAVGLEPTTY